MDDRRRHPRLKLELDLEVGSDHNFFAARTQDLSEGGLFISTDLALPMGTHLDVAFAISGRRIEVTAEVAWELTDTNGTPTGVGVRFLDLFPEERDAILAFMREREPLLFGAADLIVEAAPAPATKPRPAPPKQAVPASPKPPALPLPPRPPPKPKPR